MRVTAGADQPVEVDAHPEVGVRNSQPEGIGRVADLGDLVAWNNLGRNVVFADRQWRPVAVFGTTPFADDDELSQYDLDVHAILQLADEGKGLVVTLNHLGSVLGFAAAELAGVLRSGLSSSGPVRPVQPVISTSFANDLERTVAVGARLVSSRSASSADGGLLVSEPVGRGFGKPALDAEVALEGWGRVTALCTFGIARDQLVAVGAEGRATLLAIDDGRFGRRRFEVDLPLRAAAFAWDGRLLWAVGSELTASPVDDYRWGDLQGGRYAGLDPSNGRMVVAGDLPDEVAWGNGGVAVVMAAGRLCAVGRTGRLHWLADPRTGRFASTAALAESSLGIAHAAAVGDRVLYGFNRGGYRLHASDVRSPGHRA
ncbi:MAG: hypothetical protein ACLQRH_08210 [Acidimicrobiales bacterium]